MVLDFKKTIVLFIAAMAMFAAPSHAKKFYYFGAYPGLINAAFMTPFTGGSEDWSGDVTVSANGGVVFETADILKILDINITLNNPGLNSSDVELYYILEDEDIIYASNVVETDGDGLDRAATITRLASDPLGTVALKVSAVVNQIEEGYKTVDIIVAGNCDAAGSTSLDAGGHSIMCDENGSYLLTSIEDLLHISKYQMDGSFRTAILSGDFILTSNVSFPSYETVDWDGNGSADGAGTVGWIPLGYDATYQFSGTFDGGGNAIDNLYINSTLPYRGLFGTSGAMEVRNLGLTNVNIASTNQQIGAVIGEIDGGIIDNVYATGAVGATSNYLGGIVGHIDGGTTVTDSYSGVNVTRISGGSSYTGGFAGHINNSTVSDSYATGTVDGFSGAYVGGFAGYINSNISNSYATGGVTSTGQYVGGLVGMLAGNKTISACYASGSISGANSGVGGLVGQVQSGTINNSYSTSRVDAYSADSHGHAGGLVGAAGSMTINNSYASGIVTSYSDNQGTFAGGLLGVSGANWSSSSINNSYSSWTTAPTAGGGGDNNKGGLVGGEKHDQVTVNNAGDKCAGKDEVTPTQCLEADANQIKADYQFGLWEDSVWENPGDFNPKLEWETEGNIESTLTVSVPSACISEDPFDGMARSSSKYQIATAQQLLCLSQMPLASVLSEDYQLANDISFAAFGSVDWDGDHTVGNPEDATGFMPLGGSGNKFTGSFDGEGYSITNLYINRPTSDYVGLFGYANGATITDLTLASVNITGQEYSGSLIGYMNGGSVTNVGVSGSVNMQGHGFDDNNWDLKGSGGMIGRAQSATITGNSADLTITGKGGNVGGLIGYSGNSTISQNYTTGSLTIVNAASEKNVAGGLIGHSYGTISENYSDMSVSMNGSNNVQAGGLIGNVSSGTIKNNYATGSVTLTGSGQKKQGGGLIGRMSSGVVENSYATGKVSVTNSSGEGYSGGLIGGFDGIILNSYAGWTAGNIPTLSATSTANIGGLVGGSMNGNPTIANAMGKCNGMNEGTPTICPAVAGSLLIKADASGGLWSDSIWEVLEQDAPKLEWQTPGDIASNITINIPSACISIDPLDDMTLDSGSYLIDTKDQLLCLSQIQKDDTLTANYKLTANIAFDANEALEDWDGDGSPDGVTPDGWSPLGSSTKKFTGDFDGQGFTISNLYINRSSSYQGLFGYAQGSTITDLNLTSAVVSGVSYVGSLVGGAYTSASIDSCTASATINATSNYSGGIVGYANNSTITSSTTSGNVSSSSSYVGGLVGYNYYTPVTSSSSSVTASGSQYVGGLSGYSYYGDISNSYATGVVTGTSYYVGGLTGRLYYSDMINSYATGNVSSSNNYVGGLTGYSYGNSSNLSNITNCYATGNVSGRQRTGGAIGYINYGAVDSIYATGSVTSNYNEVGGAIGYINRSNISNSFATGNVSSPSHTGVGGFVGSFFYGVLSDSYATGSATGNTHVGGLVGGIHGHSSYTTTIQDSYGRGAVTGNTSTGGLVGYINNGSLAFVDNNGVCEYKNGTSTTCSDADSNTINNTWSNTYWAGLGSDPTPSLLNMP